MARTILFKGPMGLFLCLFLTMLGVAVPSAAQEVEGSMQPPVRMAKNSLLLAPLASSSPTPIIDSSYKGRPASVVINSIEIQGEILASDTIFRSWSQRVTPITIRYPGIDLASGIFQDKAIARPSTFNNWLADKWIDRNEQCNHIFQRNPQHEEVGGNAGYLAPQCTELNYPIKDLNAECEAPRAAQYQQELLRLRWSCKLAPSTAVAFYDEAIPSLPGGTIAIAVNPASKTRSRIPIETVD